MNYLNPRVIQVAELLKNRLAETKDISSVLKSHELKALFAELASLPVGQRAAFGKEINALKAELEQLAVVLPKDSKSIDDIDVTAPFDINTPSDKKPQILTANYGSRHPLTIELEKIIGIFGRMGFTAVESRQIDDDYNMFSSLNFPTGHPARDDYDTFVTTEGLIAPAHTSTMQNRVLKQLKPNLENGEAIAVVIPGRVFRNEDLDARHEHTFYQLEGVYVDKRVNVGHLISTVKVWLSSYYQRAVDIKTQPFYFPFTEPSFEFAASCIFCNQKGCNICSQTGWIELGGCGMIHPNVLSEAEIDPTVYTGFAWGFGIERLVMLKYDIKDIRHFEAGQIDFLRQFS